jgi:NADPH:quinone reductase-like Zn-dependent oxidoreductase
LVAVERERLYWLPAQADPVRFVAAVHPGATAYGALVGRAHLRPGECVAVVGANGAVGMCAVQVAAARGAEVIAVIRDPRAAGRVHDLGAAHVLVADATSAPQVLAAAAPRGVDVFLDTTRHVDLAAVPERLNARGRILVIAGHGHADLELWPFYVREAQLLGFIMSAMTVEELAAAADWINATYPSHPLTVSVGEVLGFDEAPRAHAVVELGHLPRLADGTVGRLVLQPCSERT